MHRKYAALLVSIAAACATERAAQPVSPPQGQAAVLRSAELARVRCLLVAPFENGSDTPLAAEAATGALLSGVDPARTRVFPIPELRGIFHDTALDLPQGLPPSLALELGELVGADAAMWGSVEGRGRDGGELVVTLRLSLVTDHQLLFADTAIVEVPAGEPPEAAIRRAVLEAVQPVLARLGDPGRKRCFDLDRIHALRKLALAETPEARTALGGTAGARTSSPVVLAATSPASSTSTGSATGARAAPQARPAPAAAPEPRAAREADWAKRLAAGGRVLVEDVAFAGRSADLQRDGGLVDLAGALAVQPGLAVRIEGFVDTTADRAGDVKLSAAMAQSAARRLAEHGIAKQRIASAGRGGESPILPNFTARGRSANRRIEAVAVQ
jgi:outer membrane protein OmpA-like peptidoglycan-associated protein